MSIEKQVIHTLKWKKSNEYCANKLGISLEKYQSIKRNLLSGVPLDKEKVIEFKENLENGTAQIKGISFTEPKSPEEIIKILRIDPKKWKLSTYWNKEVGNKWIVSALVTQIKQENKDFLADTIKAFTPKYQPVTTPHINQKFVRPCVGILSTQDLHFGKEGNNDIVKDFKEAITSLILRSYASHNMDKIIYVIGGDLLNMDTFSGTTTSGTPLDNDKRAQDAYVEAFDALYWSINYIKQFCDNLHVIYIPGNHDRLSSYHMAHALSKCFNPKDNYTFDVNYSERRVVVYGNNFFGFEHGDVNKKNTPLVYATEFSWEWGHTIYRTCYTGHFHSKKTVEFVTENEHNGFAIKHLPSLSNTDYWHYHNKFTGAKKQAVIEIHDKEYGKISEFVHNTH